MVVRTFDTGSAETWRRSITAVYGSHNSSERSPLPFPLQPQKLVPAYLFALHVLARLCGRQRGRASSVSPSRSTLLAGSARDDVVA